MRRTAAAVVGLGLALVVATPALADTDDTCSSTGICFYENPANLPITGFSQDIVRGVCRSVPDNQTTYIDNNTKFGWWVFLSTDCLGTRAYVYPHTEGPMAGTWYRSIGSTYRTSSLT